jgi:peptidoglycan/LPS O-acetylase OafA/YrhL
MIKYQAATTLKNTGVENSRKMKKRLLHRTSFADGIHGLRAFATIAVVIYHAGGSIGSEKYQGIGSVSKLTLGLASGVDLFFVISGFVISLSFFRGRVTNFSTYFLNRVLRIYPLSILTACTFLVTAWMTYGRVPELDIILSSVLLLPNGTEPIPIVLWTLKQELLFYALFSLVYFRRSEGLTLLTIWGITSPFLPHDTALMNWLFNGHNVQFLFGILSCYLFVRSPLSRWHARLLAAVSMPCFIAVSYSDRLYHFEGGMANLLLGIFGSCLVLGAACAEVTIPRKVMFLGTASYSIYLIHFFFISLGNKAMMAIIPSLPGAFSLVLLSTFATVAGCLYFSIFERRLEAWRRRVLTQ